MPTSLPSADQSSIASYESKIVSDRASIAQAQNTAASTLAKDEQQIETAQQSVVTAKQGVATARQSVATAQQQVASAKLSAQAAAASNAVKQAPPTAGTVAQLQAAVVQAENSLADARRTLAQTVLRAPTTGTVAAVNGMACGGAFYLLAEADFLIAAEHATFFDPHVTYGMPAVFEPVALMPRMPFGDLMRMTLLGNHERITAATAREIGLVTEVVPADQLEDAAMWAAERIASQPPGPVEATVRTLWAARDLSAAQATELGNVFLNLGMRQDTMEAGSEAFTSGERAKWRTR